MRHIHSFSAKLTLNVLVMISLLFLLALGIVSYWSNTLIFNEASKNAQNLLDKNISDIEKNLSTIEISVSSNAWNVREHLDEPDFLYHITKRIVGENDNIVGSAIAFVPEYYPGKHFFSPYSYISAETGEILSKQLGNEDYDYFYMEWFAVPYETGKPYWGEPYYDKGGGEQLMCTYSYPLVDDNGKIFAVMTADISLDWISKVQSGIKPYKNSNVVLISSLGLILSSESSIGKFGENVVSNFEKVSERTRNVDNILDAILNKEKAMMKYSVGGTPGFVVFAPLTNSWVAMVSCTYSDILAGTTKMLSIIMLIGILGLILMFILCNRIIKIQTKPLTNFADSATEIAKGNFETPLPEIETSDEIGLLRDSFANMQLSLRNYISELKTTTAANERYESELSIASKIQMAMLPHTFPKSDIFDLYACQKSSKEVGGDLYDFIVKDKFCYFIIGDVSGKGVPASLVMAAAKVAFRFVSTLDLTPDQMVSRINNILCENNERGMFVTFFLGKLNLETLQLQYCNAGHNPPMITGSDGQVSKLEVLPNLALGVWPDFSFTAQIKDLSAGDRITLYTDGVTEAEKADGNQYGEQRLCDFLSDNCKETEENLCTGILDSLDVYFEGRPQNDDITLLSLRIRKTDNNQ